MGLARAAKLPFWWAFVSPWQVSGTNPLMMF
jgi:hypothetical protein